MSLDNAERAIAPRLTELAGLGARVRFDFGHEGALTVDASTVPATLSREAHDAECTIALTEENFERLVAGELNATLAYMTGKLKISGSMGVAMKLAGLLED